MPNQGYIRRHYGLFCGLLLLGGVGAGGYAVGRQSSTSRRSSRPSTVVCPEKLERSPFPVLHESLPTFVGPKLEHLEAASDEERFSVKALSDVFVERIFERVNQEAAMVPKDAVGRAEIVGNTVRSYLSGLAEGLRKTSPQLPIAVGKNMAARICNGRLSQEEAVASAFLFQELPEAGTDAAFQCFFKQHQTEDTGLWYMLDAVEAAGLEPPPILKELSASGRFVDDRTKTRLLADSERAAARLNPTSTKTADDGITQPNSVPPPWVVTNKTTTGAQK